MRPCTLFISALPSLLLLGVACGVDARKFTEPAEEGAGSPPNGQLQPGVESSADGTAPGASGIPAGGVSEAGPGAGLGGAGVPASTGPRPLDLLFVIDNSISMADKQQLLGQVANVLDRFINPVCLDAAGAQLGASASGACAEGLHPQFEPVTDIHLGVISTSLGDAGANVACPPEGFPRYVPNRIDRAHLLGTTMRGRVAGINELGFISWRAGEDDIAAATSFAALVKAMGENGCGFEMTLEAWYRFLIDPHPYAALEHVACDGASLPSYDCVQPTTDANGIALDDLALLTQRAGFLRPNSRLGIVMLSDENDCSVMVGGQSWSALAIDDSRPYYRGSSACALNPNDPCCYSCAFAAPEGCAEDLICEQRDANAGSLPGRLPPAEDGQNLRCFNPKQRFGMDLLYPVARYVNALTQPTFCPNTIDLSPRSCLTPEPNPLFVGGRAPADVFLTGIVGVPADLLQAQVEAPGRPPIAGGFRYKLASELSTADWAAMVGEPSASPPVLPTSPYMVESQLERPDVAAGNPVNGREYSTLDQVNGIDGTPDDLEYACILPLPSPRDCALADATTQACDCYAGENDKPLCEQTPGVSAPGTVQYWGKAYPSTRQLEVLRGLGAQAVVGSICARNTTVPTAADFAYRPSLAALVDSMAARLAQP